MDSKSLAVLVLDEVAYLAAAEKQGAQAAKLFGKIDALREEMNSPVPPCDRDDYGAATEQVRIELGDQVFASLCSEGKLCRLEELASEV